MKLKTDRLGEITNLRAAAIFMVVLGHSIILYSSKWNRYATIHEVYALDRLKDWINLIQMPLFFAISGFLFEKNWKNKPFFRQIGSRIRRLLIPWICVGLGWMIPVRIYVNYGDYRSMEFRQIVSENFLTGQDDGHMWFLPSLFACFMLSYLCNLIFSWFGVNRTVGKIIQLVAAYYLLLYHEIFPEIGIYRDTASYLLYFQIGCALWLWRGLIRKDALTAVVGLVMLAGYTYAALFLPIPEDPAASVVIKVIFLVAVFLIMPTRTSRLTEVLARYSFGIYLFHSPLIYITFTYLPDAPPPIVVALNFLGFGTCALFLTWVISNSPFRFIIGEPTHRIKGTSYEEK